MLWAVIMMVLGFLGCYLLSTTSSFSTIATEPMNRGVDSSRQMVTYGMNVRANVVLIIGSALSLLGCMIVLRRVRTNFSADATFEGSRTRVVADSAGIVIVILGVVLLVTLVLHPPHLDLVGHDTHLAGASPPPAPPPSSP